MPNKPPGADPQSISLQIPVPAAAAPHEQEAPDDEPKPSFWELVYATPAEDWQGHRQIRLMRTTATGHNELLEKIYEPIDDGWVQAKYGGGQYQVFLENERAKIISSHRFTIAGDPKAGNPPTPAAAPAAASGAQSTADLVVVLHKLLGVLDARQQPAAPPATVTPSPIADTIKAAAEAVRQLTPGASAEDNLLTKLLNKFLDKMGAADPLQAKLVDAMVTRLLATQETNLLGQVDTLLSIADKLGGGPRHAPSMGVMLAEKAPEILDKATGLLEKARDIAERNRQANQYRYAAAVALAGTQPGRPGMAGPTGTTALSPLPGPLTPATSQAAATHVGYGPTVVPLDVVPLSPVPTVDAPAAAPATVGAGPADNPQLLAFAKGRVVDAMAHGDSGGCIIDFLHVLDDRLVEQMEGATVEQLRLFFGSDPILAKALELPACERVLEEIVEDLSPLDADATKSTLTN